MAATKRTLLYPGHYEAPVDLLNFIEAHGFAEDWERLGFDDQDRQALELLIMIRPTSSPVIKGTGGLRKMRFSKTKRKGVRRH